MRNRIENTETNCQELEDNFMKLLKEATKFYFMHYLCVVIILFNTDLYKPAFPTYPFENLVFRLSVFSIFCLFYFELDVIFNDL